jgi:hypothetical protein
MELPSNKLEFGPLDPYLDVSCYADVMEHSSLPLFFSHQGDGEGERKEGALHRPAWWVSQADSTCEDA